MRLQKTRIMEQLSLKVEATRGKLPLVRIHRKGSPITLENDNNANSELSAKATVNAWGAANNQISFGIMLRSNVLINTSQTGYTGDYVALGALDQKLEAFYKQGVFNSSTNPVKKTTSFTASAPGVGNVYDLSIKKSGNALC